MFSEGHLIWIAISVLIIAVGYMACSYYKPDLNRMLKICFIIGITSEMIKVLCVTNILPMVEPEVTIRGGSVALEYVGTGQYTPYMEMAHLPLELCSLMLLFITVALLIKNEVWRKRLLTLMYITGVIGGALGIVFAYVTADYHTVKEYFLSVRVWQFFLYHAMVVTLGLYIGFLSETEVALGGLRETVLSLLALDFPTFYLNSVLSQPVYMKEKPVGILYRTNFFSSYVNPLGIVMTRKWMWFLYLGIRFVIAVLLIAFLLWLAQTVRGRTIKNS